MAADAAGARGPAGDLSVLGARPLGPQDPAMVGRYRIHALLGIGGMGRVYLGWAQHPGLAPGRGGAWVAVKVIRPDLADDPEFRRRFARELEAVGRVRTPHAAALVHGEPESQQPWMATEFVPGVSLNDAVGPESPLPGPSVWRLAHDLGSALVAVHQAGLVHRDVKPSNVILGRGGAKIIDFGVAHASDLSQLTATGMNIGTPSYMAPEQAKSGEVAPASDVYSLGVLLYFAASGRLPFGEGGTAEVLFRVVYEEPDVSGLNDADPQLRDLVLRCMAKNPLQRPNAAGIVAMAQNAAAAGAWSPEEVAVWPEALAARISERTHAAGRTLPDPSIAGPATPVMSEMLEPPGTHGPFGAPDQSSGSGGLYGSAAAFEALAPPLPIPPVDSMQTVFTGSAPDEGVRRERTKRHGALVAGISAVAVLGLGVTAFLVWSPGSSPVQTTAGGGSSSAAADAAGTSSAGTAPGVPGGLAGGSASAGPSGSATASASASRGRSASPGSSPDATASAAGGGATSGPSASAPGAPVQQPSTTAPTVAPTTAHTTSAPSTPNKYTPTAACGSGYSVVDHHALTGATIYLLFDSANGYNCVVTMATYTGGAVSMKATLAVQGGSTGSNSGNFTYYAGPVKEHAPNSCVEWGGAYKSSSWTSGWSHC